MESKEKIIKNIIYCLLVFLLIYTIIGMFTKKTVVNTPAGNYYCKGTLLKVCTGSKEVYDYLGV